MTTYDLRSDTVTRPSPAMRRAMADADVGDDVYGEDPTVTRLEARVAELLGKEAALFVPSGTMANQIALLVQTRPGDEVVVEQNAHCANFEAGAGAAWAGVQFVSIRARGPLFVQEVEAALRPTADHFPRSSLVVIENTHNMAGGRIFQQTECEEVARLARTRGLGLHLDGARLWNAAVATGLQLSTLAAPFDTVSVCFSKGLGAPVGSAFVASAERVRAARRTRKMLGGGMRQAGILAAAALYALEHNRERLSDDHAAAQAFAERLRDVPNLDLPAVETNIVLIHTGARDARQLAEAAARRGVLIHAMGPHTLRAVTHLDISKERALEAADLLRGVLAE